MSQRTDIYACVPQKVDVKIRFQLSERSIYALVGWACGMALGLLLYWAWWPNEFLLTFPPLAGMILALWRGEATNKIPSADELNRPITLFPKDTSSRRRYDAPCPRFELSGQREPGMESLG